MKNIYFILSYFFVLNQYVKLRYIQLELYKYLIAYSITNVIFVVTYLMIRTYSEIENDLAHRLIHF